MKGKALFFFNYPENTFVQVIEKYTIGNRPSSLPPPAPDDLSISCSTDTNYSLPTAQLPAPQHYTK